MIVTVIANEIATFLDFTKHVIRTSVQVAANQEKHGASMMPAQDLQDVLVHTIAVGAIIKS